MRTKNSAGTRGTRVRLGAALLAVGLLTAACGSGSDGGSTSAAPVDTVLKMPDLKGQTITINTYGGSFAEVFAKDVTEPFEKATGATVKLVTTCCDNFASAVQKDQYAGDIVLGNDYGPMQGWSDEGLLLAEPRLGEIAKARGMDPAYYQDDLMAVDFYGYVLAWNTDTVKNPPKSWADFYDTATFKGTHGLFAYPTATLETSLFGQGVTGDQLYPLDLDKAFAGLEKLKDAGKLKYFNDGADLTNKLGTGEFDYAMGFSNRLSQAKAEGLPIDYTFDQSLLAASAAAIPKNAKNVDGAVAFLDFYMQPEIQAKFAESSALAPAYPSANELLEPDVAATMITSEQNLSKSTSYSDSYWAENFETVLKRYTDFQSGK